MSNNFSIHNGEIALQKAWSLHQKLMLHVGDWNGFFNEQEFKIIVAVALNYCVRHKEMELIGYLITTKELSLVVGGSSAELDKNLEVFEEQIIKRVTEKLKENKLIDSKVKDWEQIYQSENRIALFVKGALTNQYLIKLLTGQKIALPYYNSEVEKLKAAMINYDFCSIIDYSGAKGPVEVNTSWLTNIRKSYEF